MKTTTIIMLISILSISHSFSQKKNDSIQTKNYSLEEVVISASKTSQKIKESPISIEKLTLKELENKSSLSYYDELENLKGVDVNSSSLTFKSLNTRGFSTFANERFLQLIDGLDSSSPALNFAIGNFLGIDDLDVLSAELIPGASSPLYGANAYNGLLNTISKNPFDFPGINVSAKQGVTSSSLTGENSFTDVGIRIAKVFNDKIALKTTLSFLKGKDWAARDYNDNRDSSFNRNTTTDFDGLNIYGDEVATTLNFDAIAGTPIGTFGSARISRTGYEEEFLVNNDAENIKSSISLHIRPFKNDTEVILNSKIGFGSVLHHSSNRFAFNDFLIHQHALKVRHPNFFVNSYYTKEDAGNSYDTRFAAINVNRAWKSDREYFEEYATAYLGAITGGISGVTPNDSNVAHSFARNIADSGRLLPGTDEFNSIFNDVISDSSLLNGAKFVDKSSYFHTDFNYNFSHLFKPIEFQLGGSFRRFILDSDGTIFTDTNGAIRFNEFGIYVQAIKKLLDDRLQFTGSLRFDKSRNFDPNLSPRISGVFSLDKNKHHFIRSSFQQAFRNPTTQDQYIGLDIGSAILVGSAAENLDRFTTRPINISSESQFLGINETVTLKGRNAYENAFTLSSVEEFSLSAQNGITDPSILEISNVEFVKPEKINSFELGYRGFFNNKLNIDAYAYYNRYRDFIRQETVIAPNFGNVGLNDINELASVPNALIALDNGDFTPFQVYTNSSSKIESYGMSFELEKSITKTLNLRANYTFAEANIETEEVNFQARFNTPKHKVKASIESVNFFKSKLGLKINWRWSDSYLWESDFASGVLPARSNIDAQLNFKIPKLKSIIKIGGVNITRNEFISAPGASLVGSFYYVNWSLSDLLF